MSYGYFHDAAREYVITDPKTPVRWINYIGTRAFGGYVDHTGGALVCRGDPALNRILKYIPQLPASSFNGQTLYLRIKRSDGYQVFSPFYVPTLDPYDFFECRVGLGYTRIVSEFYGIRTDATIFVPLGGNCMIADIRLTNLTLHHVELDAIPVVEYTHPDALKQLTNADWIPQTMQSRALDLGGGLKVVVQYPFMLRDTRVNYFKSNRPVSSFETDRRRFLGDHEYGTWQRPLSLLCAELGCQEANRGDNVAALMHHLGILQPDETQRLVTQLGQVDSLAEARDGGCLVGSNVEWALGELAQFWEEYLGRLQVETPDADMNRMLNIHSPRQCYVTLNWSRDLSSYQLGFGERGIGVRDSAQDVMGALAGAPAEGRTLTETLLRVQKPDGSSMHQLNPLTMTATAGDSHERPDLPPYYSDDHLWSILAICAYLKETGDLEFLDCIVPYYGGAESGTVREHMLRAIEFTHGDVGAHGLPLLGFADWNDTVNLSQGAESLFTANLYGKALQEMIDLAAFRGDGEGVLRYRAYYAEMESRFNACAWDGDWFIRYFNANGSPLGSRQNAHGQIYLNAQSWPVISGYADLVRGRQAMQAVYEKLNTRNGIKLSTPGFDGFDPDVGGISTYPPGAKENGGIFLHANPWAMIAETLVGNGDRAYEYYCQINPAGKNDGIDEYECEPYVYSQNVLGDEHPQFGLARNSWLTGTASWVYQAATQYILGVRPSYDGLVIDPCIPRHWDGFRMTRAFRSAVYRIHVANPDHVSKGTVSIQMDGDTVPFSRVPIMCDGRIHDVRAVIKLDQGGSVP
jgi:cellobiose phosphorylase